MKINFRKFFNRHFKTLIILFLAFTILPFLILSGLVHPCWDDFDFSEYTRKNGFWKAQYGWYTSWTGKYFSVAFLSSVNPLVYRFMEGYKIITFIFIISFIVVSYFFVSEITSNVFSIKEKLIFSLTFCYLYFYSMPSVKFGFFWLTSTVVYQLANMLMFLLIILILRLFNSENKNKRSLKILFICTLIIFINGSNEVSMIALTLLLVSIFIINYILNRKFNWILFLFVSVSILSLCLVYFAPGNEVRLTSYAERGQIFYSLKNSLIDLFKFTFNQIFNLPLLIFTIFFIPYCSKIIFRTKFKNRFISINPIYSIGLFFIILFSGFFTAYWSIGPPPQRTLNVIYFIFLIGWFLNILITVNYLKNKYDFKFNFLPRYAFVILCIIILFSLLKEPNHIKNAYKDLLSGVAFTFDVHLRERYKNIYENSSDTCIVDSIKYVPNTFLFHDLTSDPKGKHNVLEAQYFDKKFIICKRYSSKPINE